MKRRRRSLRRAGRHRCMRPEPTSAARRTARAAVGLRVDVRWGLRCDWRAAGLLRRAALAALRDQRVRRAELSIAVVGRRRMRRLHRQFMQADRATDVLTFDLRDSPTDARLNAEIVVCADVALRRAGGTRCVRRHACRAASIELALYVVHGVLHLCGYDDHEPAEFQRMHAREDEILRRIGLGPVFSRRRV